MNKKGLSLVEILVSMIIMGLVMTGLVNIFISGKRWTLHSRSRITAGELGRYFLDPLQMQVKQNEWASNCLGSSTGCPASPTDDVTIDGIKYKPATVVNQNFLGTTLSKVKLTISWDEITPTP